MAPYRFHNAKSTGTEDRESRLSCPLPSTSNFVCQPQSPLKFEPSPDETVDSSVCGEQEISIQVDAYYWVPYGVSQSTPTGHSSPVRSSPPPTPTPSYPRHTQSMLSKNDSLMGYPKQPSGASQMTPTGHSRPIRSSLSKNGSSIGTDHFRRWMEAHEKRDAWQESEDRHFFEEADRDRVNTLEAWPGFAQWLAQRDSRPQSPQSFHQPTSQSQCPSRKNLTSPTSLPRSQATLNPRSARRAQCAHRIACQLTRELAALDSIRARLRRRQQKMFRLSLGSG
ncbi:hypothetical protein K443DRAFT_7658 [Laccaria amethystina LaAM-08-1]|uniref:Uncharacterized protein n=1 Tax=Laccaria amethystina LaAM-08-1 TaxID=1095629 RepID=A0A0C9XRX3_9AGAR|nr:hypothetical protein K443DRAFT_7658 [Laccaria amethystina LaAM-08-1]